MEEITIPQLKTWQSRKMLFLVDCREPQELTTGYIEAAVPLPLSKIKLEHQQGEDVAADGKTKVLPIVLEGIPEDKNVVFYCEVGKRSKEMSEWFTKLTGRESGSLEGGIEAWRKDEPVVPGVVDERYLRQIDRKSVV